MIEAMGLQRKDVYICNVVKLPPAGKIRQPEKRRSRGVFAIFAPAD